MIDRTDRQLGGVLRKQRNKKRRQLQSKKKQNKPKQWQLFKQIVLAAVLRKKLVNELWCYPEKSKNKINQKQNRPKIRIEHSKC